MISLGCMVGRPIASPKIPPSFRQPGPFFSKKKRPAVLLPLLVLSLMVITASFLLLLGVRGTDKEL